MTLLEILTVFGGGAVVLGAARAANLISFGPSRPASPSAPTQDTRTPRVIIEDIEPEPIVFDGVPIDGFPVYSEREWMARTMFGEASGEPVLGLRAVAHVIWNRVNDRSFPNSVAAVVTQGNGSQFNVWRRSDPNFERATSVTRQNEIFRTCLRIADEVMAGESADPTNGSIIYFNQSASTNSRFVQAVISQVADGRADRLEIGRHSFFPGAR